MLDPSEQNDVQHAIEEVERATDETQKRWEERKAALEAQVDRVKAFEAALTEFKDWLRQQEDVFGAYQPVAMESGRVKRQLEETKRLKVDLEPKQLVVEALNQTGVELSRESSPEQKSLVKEKLSDVNEKWDDLLDSVNERQVSACFTLSKALRVSSCFRDVYTADSWSFLIVDLKFSFLTEIESKERRLSVFLFLI